MNFRAVMLAGGQSSRMGRDKAFLEINGQTLLARQIETLAAAGVEDIVISGRAGVDYSAFECPVLADQFPGAGPLAGIHAALTVTKLPLVMVLAVDMAHMKAAYLRRLLELSVGKHGVIPRLGGNIEPLAAIYSSNSASLAEQMILARRFAAREFAATCVRNGWAIYDEVPVEFSGVFANLNSPEDMTCKRS